MGLIRQHLIEVIQVPPAQTFAYGVPQTKKVLGTTAPDQDLKTFVSKPFLSQNYLELFSGR